MNYSSHYNLNLAEGTDLVNPLTIDVPNYQTIDSTMYANEQSGVGSATELKTGTIHAITRTAPARNVFKFTATSIFNIGDTFTVDGTVVTALYPDQSSLKDRCFIVGSEILCLLTGTQLTVLATYFPEANTVTFDDTNVPFTATNVQKAIEELSDADNIEISAGVSVKDELTVESLTPTCAYGTIGGTFKRMGKFGFISGAIDFTSAVSGVVLIVDLGVATKGDINWSGVKISNNVLSPARGYISAGKLYTQVNFASGDGLIINATFEIN